jgi:y4mF family transcriptional regulator
MLCLRSLGYSSMQISRTEDISALVRQRRRELGLTQMQLATKLGVSQKYISHLETGKDTLQLGLVLRVLKALGVTVSVQVEGKQAAPSKATQFGRPIVSIDRIVDG